MSETVTGELLACPACGGTRFSWIIEEVQFGEIQRYPRDDGYHYDEVGLKRGDVVGTTDDDPFCCGCDDHVDRDALVTADEVDR